MAPEACRTPDRPLGKDPPPIRAEPTGEGQLELLRLSDPQSVETHASQLADWVLLTGSRFFAALFGEELKAREQLQRWISRRDSEFSGFLATIALRDRIPAGVVIAIPGSEVRARRRADLLALLSSSPRSWRAILKQNLEVLAGATAAIEDSDYYLRCLAVDRSQRRRGVARALLRRSMFDGAALGYSRFRLDVETDNPVAVGLYRSAGFRIVESRSLPVLGFGMHSMAAEVQK